MQTHPNAQSIQRLAHIVKFGFDGYAIPETGFVLKIYAIG